MSDLFGNHIVGFPTRRLIYVRSFVNFLYKRSFVNDFLYFFFIQENVVNMVAFGRM